MSDLRKAAQQALEAMGREIDTRRCKVSTLRAMNGPRPALAEPVQEHEDWCASVTQLLLCDPPRKAPCNCKKKVAEPVQEESL